MEDRDTSLLREFDAKLAKSGEPICWYTGEPLTFVAAAGEDGEHAVRATGGNLLLARPSALRMAPISWVADRPLYPGDTLYSRAADKLVTIAETASKTGYIAGLAELLDWVACKDGYTRAVKDMQWVAPVRKVKMWKALLKNNLDYYTSEYFYETEEAARLAIGGAYVRLLANTEIQVDVPCS